MSTTRRKLEALQTQVDESMGQRTLPATGGDTEPIHPPQFSPVPARKDIGRRSKPSLGTLDLDRVIPDPNQPRRQFDNDELARLAESLQQTGQLQPIRVRWDEERKSWIIISGERRYRAARLAGLKTIDCSFHENDLTASATLEQQLVENLQREDLTPLEEAEAYTQLMQINDWNGKQLAAALHISPSRITRAMALLSLPDDVQQQVQTGELAAATAYELTKVSDPLQQKKLASQAVEGRMTQRDIAATLKAQRRQKRRSSTGVNLTFLADNGLRVQVRSPRRQTYPDVLEALQQAVEDVQLRIDSRVFL